MEESIWERLLQGWANLNYTGLLWFVCSVFALVIGLKYYRKERNYQLFIIYTLASILLVNFIAEIIYFSFGAKGLKTTIFLETGNSLFAFIEISAFLYFFYEILHEKIIKQLIKIFWVVFLIICISFFLRLTEAGLTSNQIKKISFTVNVIEFLMLLPLCLLYFYQLLTKEENKVVRLTRSPSFWIVSGLFFYCIVSLPFLFIADTIKNRSPNLFFLIGSIHYISIILLFLCLAKAFSCKTSLAI